MQAQSDQICWVPIEDILRPGPEEAAVVPERADGAVLLAFRGDGRYTLLAGQSRLNRYQEQGRCFVDAVISPKDGLERRLSRLLDQLVKGKLHYLDEAEAYRSLIRGDGLSTQELALRTGRSVQTIRRKIRLLNLGEEICAAIREHQVCERTAEALLRMPGQQGRMKVLGHVLREKLDSKAAEGLVDEVLAHMPLPMNGGRRMKPLMRDYRLYVNAIRGIVEQMQDAGLDASIQVNMGRKAVDVRISAPLFTQSKG